METAELNLIHEYFDNKSFAPKSLAGSVPNPMIPETMRRGWGGRGVGGTNWLAPLELIDRIEALRLVRQGLIRAEE